METKTVTEFLKGNDEQLIEMGVDWNGVEHQAKQQEQQRKT